MIIGTILTVISYSLVGPAPFVPLQKYEQIILKIHYFIVDFDVFRFDGKDDEYENL